MKQTIWLSLLVLLTLVSAACSSDDSDDVGAQVEPVDTQQPTEEATTAATDDPEQPAEEATTAATDDPEQADAPADPADLPALRIGLSFGPFTLDPAQDGGGLPNLLRSMTNQALFHMNPDYTASPALVDTYGYVGEGNTVFEFTLKEGIRFTDGEPLNAEAVKVWLEYFQDSPGPFASLLNVESIETDGEYGVRLNLAEPHPLVPLILSEYGNRGHISSPKAVADPELLATGSYGVGPYVVDEDRTIIGDTYVLVPSDTYHDPDAIRFKEVEFRVISNPATMLQALQAGQLDAANIDPSISEELLAAGLNISHWRSGTVVVSILDRHGTLVPALADQRVRQALNHAVNREAIVTAMVGEYGRASSQYATEYTDPALDDRYPYDPDKARELLAEAGYEDGFTISVVDPGNLVGNWGDPTMQIVAQNWEDVGLDVDITIATTDFAAQVLSGEFSAFQWTPDTAPTLVAYLTLYGPGASLSPLGATDPEIDRLYNEALVLPPEEGAAVWGELNNRLTELAWNVPIFEYHVPWAHVPNIVGIQEGSWMPFPSDWGWQE